MTEETPLEVVTVEVSELLEKCTIQHVLTVAVKLKYLSNLILIDRFIAGIVFQNTGLPEITEDFKRF